MLWYWRDEFAFCNHLFGVYAGIGGLTNILIYFSNERKNSNKSTLDYIPSTDSFRETLSSMLWREGNNSSRKLTPDKFSFFAASVWIGILLGISGMEAWVKFKAPYVKKSLKFDIGRMVFAGVNAIELGIFSTMASTELIKSSNKNINWLILVPGAALISQVLFFTPNLLSAAKARVISDMSKAEKKAFFGKEIIQNETDTVNTESVKSEHMAYIFLEAIKLGSLLLFCFV